jgi:hypothetical protein
MSEPERLITKVMKIRTARTVRAGECAITPTIPVKKQASRNFQSSIVPVIVKNQHHINHYHFRSLEFYEFSQQGSNKP